MIGRTLGHYLVLEKIGAGGMGVVYRARDTQLEREIALKVVQSGLDESARARLLREAKTASALNHPNICIVHEAGESDGESFIAMELVEGQPLNVLIDNGALPAKTVLQYAIQIADALAHAHSRGIVHRDLKSWNVVVTLDGRPKVLDFGVAKRLFVASEDESTRTAAFLTGAGTVIGTLSHMAPELLRGESADARSDLWALGVLLYHALTGKMPFDGATSHQISSAILRDQPAPLPPQVPAGLAAIVMRLLAKQPDERYQQATEVRAALDALQLDVLQSGTRARLVAAKSPARWRRWLAAASAIVILAIAGLVAWPRIQSWKTPVASVKLSDGSTPSKNAQANEYFERALLSGASGPHQDVLQERRMLERALEADPKFAAAQAEQAFTNVIMILRGNSNDASLLYKAEDEVRQALQNDPACGHAHSVLAISYLLRGRKELVPAEIDKILQTNPNDRTAYSWLIFMHQMNGDATQALQVANHVSARWPLYWPGHAALGDLLEEQGDSAGSIREEERVLEQDPKNVQAVSFLAHNYMASGELVKARQTLERISAEDRANYRFRQYRALLLALEGKRIEAAQEMDADIQSYAALHFRGPLMAVEYYAAMGDTSNALMWMDRAVRSGDDREDWFKRDSLLASLQSNPRFQQILASVAYRRSQRPRPAPETR